MKTRKQPVAREPEKQTISEKAKELQGDLQNGYYNASTAQQVFGDARFGLEVKVSNEQSFAFTRHNK